MVIPIFRVDMSLSHARELVLGLCSVGNLSVDQDDDAEEAERDGQKDNERVESDPKRLRVDVPLFCAPL